MPCPTHGKANQADLVSTTSPPPRARANANCPPKKVLAGRTARGSRLWQINHDGLASLAFGALNLFLEMASADAIAHRPDHPYRNQAVAPCLKPLNEHSADPDQIVPQKNLAGELQSSIVPVAASCWPSLRVARLPPIQRPLPADRFLPPRQNLQFRP